MAAGAAAGFVLAFLIGPSVGMAFSAEQLLGGVLLGSAALALLWHWILHGSMSPRLPALAALVLLVHWLAAGGIGYPGVAGTFWILMALAVNETDALPAAAPPRASQRRIAWLPAAGCLLACATAIACYVLAYRPVLASYAVMARATEERQTTDERIELLEQAAQADPYSAEPWAAIAQLELARMRQPGGAVSSPRRFEAAASKLVELRPHSSAAWRQVGRWYQELYERDARREFARQAATCLQRATELYPNSAELRGEYALALYQLGDGRAARVQIAQAMALDAATPHADKKLSQRMRARLDQMDAAPR
jgi:hypothetical protein